jgi:hypothetical protein
MSDLHPTRCDPLTCPPYGAERRGEVAEGRRGICPATAGEVARSAVGGQFPVSSLFYTGRLWQGNPG